MTAFHVTRFADVFRPRWIVIENVSQMRSWRRYKGFLRELKRLEYLVEEMVLDAQDFGVPQRRKRLFLVCRYRQLPCVSPLRAAHKATAREILDPLGAWPTTELFKESRANDTVVRYLTGLEHVGPTAQFLLVYYGTDGSGGWQGLNKPLRTITTVDRFALVDQSGEEPVMRMLQVSELKRAMGFSDRFVLPHGTRRDRIKLLGNAVCPPLMQAVVQEVMRHDLTTADEKARAA